MIKITSINVNGIRSASKKGIWKWLEDESPDILCLQETRAFEEQIPSEEESFVSSAGYSRFWHPAEKPGYSGVAVYSKKEPKKISTTHLELEGALAKEGRFLELEFEDFRVASVYFPSGSSGDVRQNVKWEFLDAFKDLLTKRKRSKKPSIFCGDWNIAHKNIDIKNWKPNQKNSGFLPEEREWLDTVFDSLQFRDAFRLVNQDPDEYSWWSNRGRARENNVGWRIDYQVISKQLEGLVKNAAIYRDQFLSDHAPLTVHYKIPFK